MVLAIASMSIVLAVLVLQLLASKLWRALDSWAHRELLGDADFDRGRELRAEQRARKLLRSCVNEEEWQMYRDLGFIRVWGSLSVNPHAARNQTPPPPLQSAPADCAYLIYPHRPIVAYLPQTATLLSEYCVTFPDHSLPHGSALPPSDDVLAKWMALKADEARLVAEANMHLPGRQIDPLMVRRDLTKLARWERERLAERRRNRLQAEAARPQAGHRHALGA